MYELTICGHKDILQNAVMTDGKVRSKITGTTYQLEFWIQPLEFTLILEFTEASTCLVTSLDYMLTWQVPVFEKLCLPLQVNPQSVKPGFGDGHHPGPPNIIGHKRVVCLFL